MTFQILEPDVTFTDYGLAVLSLILAWMIYSIQSKNKKLKAFIIFFYLSLALTSLLGGTAHGFFLEKDSFSHVIFWKSTLVAIGLTAFSLWLLCGHLLFQRYNKIIFYMTSSEFILYVAYVTFVNDEFKVAVYNYAPPTILLFFSMLYLLIKSKNKLFIPAVLGIFLTFIAAWIQQSKIFLHPFYFNHNALYHSIQAISLLLIYVAFRLLLKGDVVKERQNSS